ncbi:MAG: tetratricopeptide repeat protein [Anaerolineales bacterium]|nr:tetratricopeptide repeat protein [Anaerolineales bacterium]
MRRGRLVDKLHQNTSRKLNFVCASAGFGKTSLMLDFANELDAVVCWYQIARGDEDLGQFVRYLVMAMRHKFKGFGQGLENLLNMPGGALNPQSLATAMVNEVVSKVNDFCVLFLDDFHIVGETSAISEFLEAFLDYLPDQLRVVIASRSVYGIPTAKLYIRNQIAPVGVDDLRFSAEEISELVRQNFKLTILPAQAERLAKRSDGWIVAILLSMQNFSQGSFLPVDGFSAEQVYVFLAQEVVARESEALQAFMLATSIQDEFSEPFITFLLGNEKVKTQALLQELEGRNLFITRIEAAEGTVYRYHQLFLDFLQDRLAKTNPERKAYLHRRAAEWYQARAAWGMAIIHQLAAGNRAKAAAWMDAAARNFYVTGQGQVLGEWVDALATPSDIRLSAPHLLLNWAKVLSERGDYVMSEHLLNLAEPVLQQRLEEEQLITLLVARGIICYMQGRFDEAQKIAETILEALSGKPFSEEVQLMRLAEGRWLNGISLAAKGDYQPAIKYLTESIQGFRYLFETIQDDELKIHILYTWGRVTNDLGSVSYEDGNILAAQTYFQDTLNLRKKNQNNLLGLAESLNNIGYLHFQTGAYSASWDAYQEALELLKPIKPGSIHIHLYNSIGDLLFAVEEWKASEEAYLQAFKLAKDSQFDRALFATYCGMSKIAIVHQQYSKAMQWLRDAARVRKISEDSPLYQEKIGEIYMEMGQLDLAIHAFVYALKQWENSARPHTEQILAAFYLGKVLFLKNQCESAMMHLQTALTWGARLGVDQFLVLAGRRAGAFLEFALTTWPEYHQLQSLWERIQAFRPGLAQLLPPTQTTDLSAVRLEVYALGAGQVRRDGHPIAKAAWQSSKPRALFFYLVEHQEARASELKLDFWPEFNTSRATTNLQATLWRARNALENKDIILNQDEEYALAPGLDFWYDVAEFRNYLARAANPSITPFEGVEYWRRAVELYQGDYLADIMMDWAETIRRELRESYLATVLNLAKWEVGQHHYSKAIYYYEKAIEKEPFEDNFHRAIMECWVSAHLPANAKRYFLQYRKKLEKEGLTISQQLLEYYTSLFGGKRSNSSRQKK